MAVSQTQIEAAVRTARDNGAEKVRLELIQNKRFSGGFVPQLVCIQEFAVVPKEGFKDNILKSGKLAAHLVNSWKNDLPNIDTYIVSPLTKVI